MATPFTRTVRSLEADDFKWPAFAMLGATMLFGGWAYWFFASEVPVYAVSPAARVEAVDSVMPVEAPVSGRVTAVRFQVGQDVKAGQLLVELDARDQRAALDAAEARMASLELQKAALEREIDAAEQAIETTERVSAASTGELTAKIREGRARARMAEKEANRAIKLHRQGTISEAELQQRLAALDQEWYTAKALKQAQVRTEAQGQSAATEVLLRLEQTRRQIAGVIGQIGEAASSIARYETEIELRQLRAASDGFIGGASSVQVGSVIPAGHRFATVIADGELSILAYFPPFDVVGQVRPGMEAEMRVIAFPWLRYGTLPAKVARIASEAREGMVRVELEVDRSKASRIPVEHGLQGSVEIEVERVSPAELVFRAVGKVTGAPAGYEAGPPSGQAKQELR